MTTPIRPNVFQPVQTTKIDSELLEGLPGTPITDANELMNFSKASDFKVLLERGYTLEDRWTDPSQGGMVHLKFALADSDVVIDQGQYQQVFVEVHPNKDNGFPFDNNNRIEEIHVRTTSGTKDDLVLLDRVSGKRELTHLVRDRTETD
jgi:hypothetical protein